MKQRLTLLPILLSISLAIAGPADASTSQELLFAAYRSDAKTVETLLDKGAPIDATDANGYTPLHWAAFNGNVPIMTVLLAHGAAIDARDHSGYTPLILASWNGRLEAVKFLVAHGADAQIRSRDGFVALDYARSRGHQDIVAFLSPAPVQPTPAPIPTPTPQPTPTPTPTPTPRPVPTPQATSRPVPEATPRPHPTVAPRRMRERPGNTLSPMFGLQMGQQNAPVLGIQYQRALGNWFTARVGYGGGWYTPAGAQTQTYFTRLDGALLLGSWIYAGAGVVRSTTGAWLPGPASTTSYEAIAGLKADLGGLSLGGEYRYGLQGPSLVNLWWGGSF